METRFRRVKLSENEKREKRFVFFPLFLIFPTGHFGEFFFPIAADAVSVHFHQFRQMLGQRVADGSYRFFFGAVGAAGRFFDDLVNDAVFFQILGR